ncbi:uncharacterized protein K452DRAFT_160226 [Aplosporella prunicola CBS 121167]|uniref:Uncharacterized protein n=1 Tax=Aplosporella prunicola CBS 121167 TaxID=1176127 RepID=A0A6A6BJV7_9PEZI|nr:uncharacterized protein K452DRAFT_160226 [Aplosporella prunicola CBS 121167]KAF2143615.1 hypothetical protein K452DRAFT_160226 [Aplosporella prunicola CBS 121167]
MSNATIAAMEIAGWTSGPDGRGTFDIIWNSIITIFLCSWTVLCLNLPPEHFNEWLWARQKLLMTCLVIVGPEFLLQISLGQWLSACRSVKQFQDLGHRDWTMKHAFLADMGGYVLDSPEEIVQFPLTAKQVQYLVERRYLQPGDVVVKQKLITDRNKGDGMTRLITVCQISWFSLNCVGRLSQRLAITTLELTALANIFCTLATYFFWRHKPLDVKTAIPLRPNTALRLILSNAVAAGEYDGKPYKRSPLEFVELSDPPTSWDLYWTYGMGFLRSIHVEPPRSKRRPVEKISDDSFFTLSAPLSLLLFFFQLSFAAIDLAGWNLFFPTSIERTLWHAASTTIIVCVVLYWIVDLYVWQLLPSIYEWSPNFLRYKRHLKQSIQQHVPSIYRTCHATAVRLRNNTLDHDPRFDTPLKAAIPIGVFCAFYCSARAFVLVESFVSLRLLPKSAYETVQWTLFIPHF